MHKTVPVGLLSCVSVGNYMNEWMKTVLLCAAVCPQWINNLETERRYAGWPSNVQELLRPTFPGVIRQIRKNFHNLVRSSEPLEI